jgi:hypothetical protein
VSGRTLRQVKHERRLLTSWPTSSSATEPPTCTDSRSRAEVAAESVAYVVASSSGLDTSANSFPYIGRWAPAGKEADVLADTAERVITTARRILAGLDTLEAA